MNSARELAAHPVTVCHKTTPPLSDEECEAWLRLLPHWSLHDHENLPYIERHYRFSDFAAALLFTNRVGELAEAANHHPAVLTEWGRVNIRWWTHSIGGLHLNDFIMAARCDAVYSQK